MSTGAIIGILLLVAVAVMMIKRSMFEIPKWKTIYFKIVKNLNDGDPEAKIKSDLVDNYNMTSSRADAAILAAKEYDTEWFENENWE